MTEYNIGLSDDRKTVYVSAGSDALPAEATEVLSDFVHGEEDSLNTWAGNHVLYHHVREALYHEGILDMQRVKIVKHGPLMEVTDLVISAVPDIEEAATETLAIKYLPSGTAATLSHFDFASSDEDIATVSAAGEVTGVAEGTAVITATHKEIPVSGSVTVTIVPAA